jgi:DNA recombination protein RmuC
MQDFFVLYSFHILVALISFVAGGVIFSWWFRRRLKGEYHPRLVAADTRIAVLEEQVNSLGMSEKRLENQVHEVRQEALHHQTRVGELTTLTASLETRLESIPALKAELAQATLKVEDLQEDLRKESSALAQAVERSQQLSKVEADRDRKADQIDVLNSRVAQFRAEMAELETVIDKERKQADEKIALLNDARDQLKNEFKILAQKIFEDKGLKFTDQNRANMDQILGPLREQLGEFKKRVEDVYDREARDRTALFNEISHLKELNQRISREAINLTRALKGDSKARGNWGEVILERVLEASGLQKGREYDVQVSLSDSQGKRYQPDVIVHLPEGKQVIIDAKVALTAYETYYSAEDSAEKATALDAHINSLRTHVKGLAGKSYEDLEGVRSLDFVLMFIPIEAAFLAAVEKDRNLFSEAFDKNIILVSPSTLLVTLRTIQNIWRYEYQNRYALEIAKKAGGLYDKFVGFVEGLEEVGKQLDRARDAYRTTHNRLVSGKGNLVRRTQELKALGVKAGKELSPEMIELARGGAEEGS